MKRKVKVDLDELDTALNWDMSEWTVSSPRWTTMICRIDCGVPSAAEVRFGVSKTSLPVIRM